jgi:hypothetical protein
MENTGSTPQKGGYGYSEHVAKDSAFVFGLNAGNVRLTKFEHTANGGKDGAAMEALDIMFTIDGAERGYRKFPISRAYGKDATGNQIEITDAAHPAFIAEQQQLSSVLVHIVGCFVEKADIQAALNRQIGSFKQFAEILASLLPAGFADVALDGWGQYQWQINGENKVTFLEFPKNMKHGRWIQASVTPKDKWEKQQRPNAADNEVALRYVDADGVVHPFSRNGWYMASNFAKQQKEAPSAGGTAMQNAGAAQPTSGDW